MRVSVCIGISVHACMYTYIFMCTCQACVLDGGFLCEGMHVCEHTVVHICVSVAVCWCMFSLCVSGHT